MTKIYGTTVRLCRTDQLLLGASGIIYRFRFQLALLRLALVDRRLWLLRRRTAPPEAVLWVSAMLSDVVSVASVFSGLVQLFAFFGFVPLSVTYFLFTGSIAIVSPTGKPAVLFVDQSTVRSLRYLHCDDFACSSSVTRVILASGATMSFDMDFASDGSLFIAFAQAIITTTASLGSIRDDIRLVRYSDELAASAPLFNQAVDQDTPICPADAQCARRSVSLIFRSGVANVFYSVCF